MELVQSVGLQDLQGKQLDYRGRYDQLVKDVENLSPGELKAKYKSEYSSWSNRKHWAKVNDVSWSACMNTFAAFLLANGPIPEKSWTLDRIDPKGHYTPGNIRWASKRTQAQNRTSARAITIRGVTYTLSGLAKLGKRTYDAVRMGIHRKGHQYVAKLLAKPDTPVAPSEELLWQFPEDHRSWLEERYENRGYRDQNRLRFFIPFAKGEYQRLGFADSIASNPANKALIQEEMAEVKRLHNEAVAHLRKLLREQQWKEEDARREQMFGQVGLPSSPERDMDDPAACRPYDPY